jgi:hypothetical protein
VITTTARNATLADIANMLQTQQARKLDIVAPATSIRFENGLLYVQGTEPVLSEDGVTLSEGVYLPTQVFDEGLSAKLGVPLPYVRRMRAERPDLYDANANGWLADGQYRNKSFMLRLFTDPEGGQGVARAMLSDRFKRVDNLDVLMAALDGVRRRGLHVDIDGADLSERRMSVRLIAPEVTALAPLLLERYRSPFSGQFGKDLPIVEAGLVLNNSETGGGAFTIVPRFRVLVCKNGVTVTKDAVRNVHLGGRLEDGVVQWTDDTQQKNLDLIAAKTADAVATFLNKDYMTKVITEIEVKAGVPVSNPVETIKVVGKKLAFTDEQQAGILDHFIKAADTTAGGVMQAVTSFAQTVADPDAANMLEEQGMRALDLAVAAQS